MCAIRECFCGLNNLQQQTDDTKKYRQNEIIWTCSANKCKLIQKKNWNQRIRLARQFFAYLKCERFSIDSWMGHFIQYHFSTLAFFPFFLFSYRVCLHFFSDNRIFILNKLKKTVQNQMKLKSIYTGRQTIEFRIFFSGKFVKSYCCRRALKCFSVRKEKTNKKMKDYTHIIFELSKFFRISICSLVGECLRIYAFCVHCRKKLVLKEGYLESFRFDNRRGTVGISHKHTHTRAHNLNLWLLIYLYLCLL